MDDAARIDTARRYLRRVYANDVSGLRQLAAKVAAGAFSAVTLTGQAFEGGSHSGQLTFEPLAYLTAIEDVLSELDPTAPLAEPDRTYARFSPPPCTSPVGAAGCSPC